MTERRVKKHGCTEEVTEENKHGVSYTPVTECVELKMNGWMGGWMSGWMGGWMDG